VDSLGGLADAVRVAGTLAGIAGKPQLVRPRRQFRWADLADWAGSHTALGTLLAGRAALTPWPLLGATKLPLYLME
jgi:hypothetical protein